VDYFNALTLQAVLQSPQRTHSGEAGCFAGSSMIRHVFAHSPQDMHFSLSQRILRKAILLNSAYIAPSGQSNLQKGL